MNPTPDRTLDDPQQIIAELQRQLAESNAERDEAQAQKAAIAEILEVTNSSLGDLPPVFDAILEKAMRLCGIAFGMMTTFDGEHFHPVCWRGLPGALSEYFAKGGGVPSRSSGMHAQLLGGAALVHVPDMKDEEAYRSGYAVRHAFVDLGGARTGLAIALRRDGTLLGTFILYRQEVRPFTDKQIALLQNFAAQAVIAMENARLITETREALDQQTATAEVLGVINSSPGDLAPVFDALLEKALRLCDGAFGVFQTYDGEFFHAAAVRGMPPALAEFMRQPFRVGRGATTRRLADGEQIVHIADMAAEEPTPGLSAMVEMGNGRTVVFVALRREETLLGFIAIYRQEVRPFTDKQIALLQNFAAQAVIAIENARLITETREALEQQTATAEVLQVINSSPGDLAPVFDAILEKAHSLCGADLGSLFTYDGERFWLVASQRPPGQFRELMREGFRPGPGNPFGRVLEGEPLVQIADIGPLAAQYPDDAGLRVAVEVGLRTFMIVPLRRDNVLLGVITANRREVRPFTEKQIALLQNFAAQAVIAMENARLLGELRQRTHDLEESLEYQTATSDVLKVISRSTFDLQPVLDTLVQTAKGLCGAASGGIALRRDNVYRYVALLSISPEWDAKVREVAFAPGRGTVIGRVAVERQVVHIADTLDDPEYALRESATIGNLRTLLGVPLLREGEPIGVLMLAHQRVQPFTDRQIELVRTFADQAVIAIENARLITETREALEQQTATAEVLQVINSSPGDLAPVFDAMLEKAMRLCEAGFGSLMSYDGDVFSLVALRNLPSENFRLGAQRRAQEGSLLHRLVDGENIIEIEDIAASTQPSSLGGRAALTEAGARSMLWVALRREGKLVGAMNIYRTEVRPFTDKQIALLQNFAAQAVIAMENARLLGELRQRTEEVGELNRDLEARVAEQVDELGRVGRLKRFLAPQLAELIVSQGDEKILESHRREIVVVFCDLRGYTAFTETAEPEEVLDFLREYHGALGPLVSQFEGTLDQFSGDGIMVFFNDPVPIPDPAERAVKMAVAMRSAANTLIADWRERGRDLGFGAGIAQGYATLGQIGFSERSGYTAIGTVCNVAARLCAEAKDGQILLGQRVNVALKGSVATEQLGPLTLKGLTQPVVAYNVPLQAAQPALRVIEGGSPETV